MITKMSAVLIQSEDKEQVLGEMVESCLPSASQEMKNSILEECLERERAATTVAEKGLAFPHAKIQTEMEPVICAGYSRTGVEWDSSGEIVHIVVLLVCHEDDHLKNLAEMAAIMQVPGIQEKLACADTPEGIIRILEDAGKFRQRNIPQEKERMTHALVRQIAGLLESSTRSKVLLFSNIPSRVIKLLKELKSNRLSLVTNLKEMEEQLSSVGTRIDEVFLIEGNLNHEKDVLRELWTRERLREGEILICISGFEHNDMPHNISLTSIPWDLYNESRILSYRIPHKINLEILSRVIYLASELARQGREGKPVGTIFVVGEYRKVEPYCKQLIINPFGGMSHRNRSILDPSLSETIKEFSKIDGAFIIGNDGQIHSVGTYLSVPPNTAALPPGLGARHAAARGITLVAPVVSVVISESTGTIRIFWDGKEQDKYS